MENKILNPKTNRYVLKTGKIGKELLKILDKKNIIRLNDDILYYITSYIEFDLFVISNIIKVSKLYRTFYLKYKKELSIYNTFINNNNYINIFLDRIIVRNKLYLKKQKFIRNLLLEDKCKVSFKYQNSNNYSIILYDIYELMLLAIELKFGTILKK